LKDLPEPEQPQNWHGKATTKPRGTYIMDTRTRDLEELFSDPDYDQSRLQEWFQHQYGENWHLMWNRYLETGRIFT
jgi:hypothetical protein